MASTKSLSEKIRAIPAEPIADGDLVVKVPNRAAKRTCVKNGNLHKAKTEKNDEFYTRLEDIEAEIKHYRKYLKGKVVLCNCDDPEWSNFFRFFALNFMFLGLKKLISTHYDQNGKSYALVVDGNLDMNGDGKIDLKDAVRVPLEGNGDFRSEECVKFLGEADVVVSNPPFSLFREYVELLMQHNKKFIIVGNKNAITYKEVFKHIKANKLWVGMAPLGKDWLFGVPNEKEFIKGKKEGSAYRIIDGTVYGRAQACWFTNLPHNKRNTPLDLVGNEYSPEKYPKYDNYEAIEVSKVSEIPDGYKGVMGVPITFLDKYCPEQFEILGATESEGTGVSNGLWDATSGVKQATIDGMKVYKRLFIKAK